MTWDKWNQYRKRLSAIIEVGNDGDFPSQMYDLVNTLSIVLNLLISIALTYDSARMKYGTALLAVESLTYLFFGCHVNSGRCLIENDDR